MLLRLEQLFYRFDGEYLGIAGNGKVSQRDPAAGVEGDHIIGNLFPRGYDQTFFRWNDLGYRSLKKTGPTGLSHLLNIEPDFLGTVGTGQHPWSHPGIVMMHGRTDEGHLCDPGQ